MKRRSFLLASGSAILTGTAISGSQTPVLGLEFELSQIPKQKPSNLDSLVIEFSKLTIKPKYLDEKTDLNITATLTIEDTYSTKQTISIKPENNSETELKSDIGALIIDGINTSKDILEADIKIKIDQNNFSKTYSKSFTIQDGLYGGATGGTTSRIKPNNNTEYQRHVFTSNGTLSLDSGVTIDVLAVGGGGGGASGGGGAGGLVYKSNIQIDSGDYDIIVGSGGIATARDEKGGNGGDSFFDRNGAEELKAIGGGGGGANSDNGQGKDGGSGGGTGTNAGVNGGSALQPGTNPDADIDAGNEGGYAPDTTNPNSTAGGGGANENGGDATRYDEPGYGGDGIDMSDEFGSDIGDNGYFAGGAAGGGINCLDNGSPKYFPDGGLGGGSDGGGDCASDPEPTQPVSNTGGGGGHGTIDRFVPKDGADGIVVVRIQPK